MLLADDLLSGLLTASPDALLAFDAQDRIIFVSDQAERLFQWPRVDLLGQQVERLIPERFLQQHPEHRDVAGRDGSSRQMVAGLEPFARRRDGSEFPADISLSSFATAAGTIMAATIRDVTDADRSERRLRAVLASASDAIVGVDASGTIILLNAQAATLFGWDTEDLLGRQIEEVVPEASLERHILHRQKYVEAPRTRPMNSGLQPHVKRKDGSTFPADISLITLQERDGLLTLATVRDVSDSLALEQARQQEAIDAQRDQSHRMESLGQLAGGVAHDFNNLLGVILNYSTLLGRELDDPQAIADVKEITAAAERAAALTRQLLAFARRDVAHREPLEVNEVVTGFAALLVRTLGENIELRLDLAPRPCVVLADRNQLEQILLNLALNSRDAMPAGGQLTIATEVVRDENAATGDLERLVLDVIDTGCGMDAAVRTRAFEPFFSTKAAGDGTGLGLATVYGIVTQNDGHVVIESSPQIGTRVSVALPLVHAEVKPIKRSAAARGGDERLLLVEDQAALRRVTERILVEHGYEVVTASDGLEALELFERVGESFDLVISDVVMPRLRGDELARLLAEREPTLRVLLMSGYASGDVTMPARLLEKPISERELLHAVREVLDA